ncbi:MAG: hypothetical protein MH204_10000, partial [Fimbriimonadaceae bacterium]|nr:hypothetical protein [Fimbriimonadaceae bacterium]
MSLSGLDLAIIGGFLVLLAWLAFSPTLKKSGALEFLAAGRSLTLPLFVATLVSTWYGGVLAIGESVTYYGLGTWTLLAVPYWIFAALYAFTWAGRVRAADQISIPERLESGFGRAAGLAGGGLVFLLAVPAAHVLMLSVLLQLLTGLPVWACLVFAGLIGGTFLLRGGLISDVRVSLAAFLAMYLGFAVIVVWSLIQKPLPAAWSGLDGSLFRWDGGQGPLAVAGFFLLGAWTLIDPGFHQRTAGAADPKTARNGILVSVFFWMLFDLMTVTTGMYALAAGVDASVPLLIFPRYAMETLPPGL